MCTRKIQQDSVRLITHYQGVLHKKRYVDLRILKVRGRKVSKPSTKGGQK